MAGACVDATARTVCGKENRMSLREEQCNKVCRILDDVLANRPTERDSLIVAVRKAFEVEPHWIPCSERRLPESDEDVLVQMDDGSMMVDFRSASSNGWFWAELDDEPVAWMPLPEPYKGVTT